MKRSRLLMFVLLLVTVAVIGSVVSAETPEAKQDFPDFYTEAMVRWETQSETGLKVPEAMSATPCVDGDAGGYPCNNVDLLQFMPLGEIGSTGGTNDIWGWTDPNTGVEYALVGLTNGTAFVDLSDPENAFLVGVLPTHTTNSSWRDIKVYADHAFIGAEASGHGMQIFDLTQLAGVANPPVTFSNTAHYAGFGNSHNIVINEDSGYAYAVGANTCLGGLDMIDISDPVNPVDAGCFSSDGYTHDAQCVNYTGPDADYTDQEICFNYNEDTLTIVDVTDKNNPAMIARQGYSGSGYTHQGWVTEDQAYLLLDDELDETGNGHNTFTYIWNIMDLDNPMMIDIYDSGQPNSDHNLYIKDDFAFQSNYSGGLHILDVSDIGNRAVTQVAFFDTYPPHNNAGAGSPGTWSNYPYFDSGIVIVTEIEAGLFILQPNFFTATNSTLFACDGSSTMTDINISEFSTFSGDVTLSTTGLPAGATSAFAPNPVTVPGTSAMTVMVNGVAAGTHPFTVDGNDGVNSDSIPLTLEVAVGNPAAANLLSPPNGASGQSSSQLFDWDDVAGTVTYNIEVATDAAFTDIVASASGLTDSEYAVGGLAGLTTFYWRVEVINGCGGTMSETWNFTTGPFYCSTPGLSIPDNDPNGATDDLVVDNGDTITDLDISLDVSHSWVGDIMFTIEHVDTGTTATLFDRPGVPGSTFGCADNNVMGTADDEGNIADIENHCPGSDPWLNDSFVPTTPLSVFDGESLDGTWRLFVSDQAGGDTGTVNEWCLLPEVDPTAVEMSDIGSQGNSNLLVIALIGLVTTLTAGSLLYTNRRNEA